MFLILTCDVRSPIPTHDRMAMGAQDWIASARRKEVVRQSHLTNFVARYVVGRYSPPQLIRAVFLQVL